MQLCDFNLKNLRALSPVMTALVAIFFFWGSHSDAAKIIQVKGDQVLVDTTGTDVQITEGARYYVIIEGKKKGAIQVTKVKGAKAIAKIIKGKAEVDSDIQPLFATTAPPAEPTPAPLVDKSAPKEEKAAKDPAPTEASGFSLGGLAGLGLDSQTVTSPLTQTSTTTTGTGYSLKAFGDLPLSGPLGVIARVGVEQINLSGSGGINTNILYASGDLLLRYNFYESTTLSSFGSIGMGLHFPVTKSSNILDTPNISSTMVFFGGVGTSYSMSPKSYLTAIAEYGYFPSSGYVTTSLIAVRAGMGFRY